MNNANAVAIIETGILSTEKMLDLCEKANDDDPGRKAVVHAFVRNWKAINQSASNQNLIDTIVGQSSAVQGHVIYAVASEMSREDFEYGFQKLACDKDLINTAGASGKYNQEDLFRFSEQFDGYAKTNFWTNVVYTNILDTEGLYTVAMLGNSNSWGMQELCVHIISKKMLSAEQLMKVCEKYRSNNDEAMAAIATGFLSDDQIISLFSMERQRSLEWDEVAAHLRLEERTVDDLVSLGEKVDSDKLWPFIIKAIESKNSTSV